MNSGGKHILEKQSILTGMCDIVHGFQSSGKWESEFYVGPNWAKRRQVSWSSIMARCVCVGVLGRD